MTLGEFEFDDLWTNSHPEDGRSNIITIITIIMIMIIIMTRIITRTHKKS